MRIGGIMRRELGLGMFCEGWERSVGRAVSCMACAMSLDLASPAAVIGPDVAPQTSSSVAGRGPSWFRLLRGTSSGALSMRCTVLLQPRPFQCHEPGRMGSEWSKVLVACLDSLMLAL